MKETVEQIMKERWEKPTEDKYLEICRTTQPTAKLDVGASRERSYLLLGMRFYVVGNFKETTNEKLEKLIREMGGTVLSGSTAELILKKHSVTPHCYIVMHERKRLDKALTGQNKQLSSFTGGDWKFSSGTYIKDTSIKELILDVEKYLF